MIRHLVIIVILLHIPAYLFSQGESNNWLITHDRYISFNSGSPEFVLPPPGECGSWTSGTCHIFLSDQSSSSISDIDGNLLLYSNGDVIFNKAFDTLLILNSQLLGNEQSSQCMFIKRPGFNSRYYLFTTPFIMHNAGVRYTEIDLSLNNGLGGALLPYINTLHSPACQKVTGVYHANGKDIWVMVHEYNSNAFCAYLVTEAGIDTVPVVSNVGTIHQEPIPPNPNMQDKSSAGEMKFSTNGKRLAVAIRGLDIFEFFDFDNETGVVSNPVSFSLESAESVEFSPDGTIGYIGNGYQYSTVGLTDTSKIFQINLLAGDSTDIVNSIWRISIDTISERTGQGFLQMGPDNKIYASLIDIPSASDRYISVIESPNIAGTGCNYIYNHILLDAIIGGNIIQLLPNFFRSWLDRNIVFSGQCLGDTTIIHTQTNDNFDSICWVFSNPLTGQSFSIPNQDTVIEYFSQPGAYAISLLRYRNGLLDSTGRMLFIKPNVDFSFTDDTVLCEGQELSFQLSSPYCNYAWVNNFSTDTVFGGSVNISTPGKWWPVLTNHDDFCGTLDTFNLIIQPDTLNIGEDAAPNCIDTPVLLDASVLGDTSYQWSTGDTTASITVSSNGYYSVTVQQNHCTIYDTILIVLDDPIQIDLGDTLTYCDSLEVEIAAGDFPADFLWSPGGQTTSSIMVNTPGPYTVTASNGCGTEIVSTLINMYETPIIDLGNDSSFCFGDTVLLHNFQSGFFEPGSYSWSTGDSVSQISVASPGLYSLSFTNICGSDMDTVYYDMDYPPIADLGSDTIICEGTSITIGTQSLGDYLWYPNGETTQTITVWDADVYNLVVSNACGTVSDVITIELAIPLPIELGPDQVICTGDSMIIENTLTLPPSAGTYIWNTGDSTETVTAMQSGTYTLSISNACGTFTDSTCLQVDSALCVNLGNDTTICLGDQLYLSTPSSPYNTYLWSTGESSTDITVYDAGQYGLSVTNTCGTYSASLVLATHENTFAFPFDTLWLNVGDIIDAGPGYTSYHWWNGSTSQGIAALDSGLHWVEVTDSLGCYGSDSVWVNFPDGIFKPSSLSGIKVYPNPVKDELVIVGLNLTSSEGHVSVANQPAISLWNSLGQEVILDHAIQSGGNTRVIDMLGQAKGIYLLVIEQGNEKKVVKVMKE